ncbi:uncharacterized protein LOC107218938 [Neodiprion lecontei]|uniref:Uncharacterized protein LOC107218938 n=1 Tax=Neodiprion lecontei TaxID=441921 RepID=A0A6J0BDM8_NEOLC|nr:uncharacterized protein LOC107218938 [Neodiprion lecontei]
MRGIDLFVLTATLVLLQDEKILAEESKATDRLGNESKPFLSKQTAVAVPVETSTAAQAQVTATREGPCHCANGVCGCCSRILLSTFRQKACVNVTYEPDDFRFTANVLMNDRVLYTRSVSGKNPRPFCVPVPRIPIVRACVRFYNIYFQGRNVHACVNMEGKFQDTTLFKVGLDCLRLGSKGVAVVKPEDGGGLGLEFLPEDDDDDDDDDDEENDEYEGNDAGDNDDDDEDDDDDLFDY